MTLTAGKTLTAGSFASGIGAMDYAVAAAGFNIKWQIEKDEFCQRVLTHHRPQYWPEAVLHGDAKKVRGTELYPVDLVFGGPPCQPYSVAGNRRGAADDRHLWPEMLRLIQELHPRPRFVLVENVTGIIRVFLATLLADLENAGYTPLPPLVIPAASVGAPHKRDRVWIMAYANELGQQKPAGTATGSNRPDGQQHAEIQQSPGRTILPALKSGGQTLADRHCDRKPQPRRDFRQIGRRSINRRQTLGNATEIRRKSHQSEYRGSGSRQRKGGVCKFTGASGRATQSPLGTDSDGLAARLVRHPWPAPQGAMQFPWEPPRTAPSDAIPERAAKVASVGNAVVPQVVYPIAVAIHEWLEDIGNAA